MVTKVTKHGLFWLIFARKPPLFYEIGGTYRIDSPYLSTRLLGAIGWIGGTKLWTKVYKMG
jgi:hypothetical protein